VANIKGVPLWLTTKEMKIRIKTLKSSNGVFLSFKILKKIVKEEWKLSSSYRNKNSFDTGITSFGRGD